MMSVVDPPLSVIRQHDVRAEEEKKERERGNYRIANKPNKTQTSKSIRILLQTSLRSSFIS
jgi:hypothetical protein